MITVPPVQLLSIVADSFRTGALRGPQLLLVAVIATAGWANAQSELELYRQDREARLTPAHGYVVGQAPESGEFFSAATPGSYTDTRGVLSAQRVERRYVPDVYGRTLIELSGPASVAATSTRVSPRSPRGRRAKRGMAVRLTEEALFSEVGRFALRLPWDRERYLVSATRRELRSLTDYTYHGTVTADSGEDVGYLLVMREGDRYFGSLTVAERSFRLEPLGRSGAIALLEEADPESDEGGCLVDGDGHHDGDRRSSEDPAATSLTSRSSGSRQVRILVMFTDAAEDRWDVEVSAERSMEETQQALLNSGISTSQLSVQLVGVERLPGFVENARDPRGDLNAFAGDLFVERRRRAVEADLIILLTDANYSRGTQGAAITRAVGDWRQAHAIVEVDAPGNRQTFTHEIGHLFGGSHEAQESDWAAEDRDNVARYAFPHQWKHDFLSVRRSSMLWSGPGLTSRGRELRFSNPDLWSAGERTGIEGQRDMAQQLRDQAARVAGYINVPRLAASVSGSSRLSVGSYGTYSVRVSNCGGATPSYTWEQSNDGRTYRRIGTSSSVRIRASNTYSTTLRLTVRCAGQTATAFKTVYIGGGGSGPSECGGSEILCLTGGNGLPDGLAPAEATFRSMSVQARAALPGDPADSVFGFRVATNPPTDGLLGLEFAVGTSGPIEIVLRDLVTGRTVLTERFASAYDGSPVEVNLPGLAPGPYAVTCSSGSEHATQLVTIPR